MHIEIDKMLPVYQWFDLCLYVSQFDQGVLIQSCTAGAKNFTNYVFSHPQFSGVIHNIGNYHAILTLIVYAIFYEPNQFYRVKIVFLKHLHIWHSNFGKFGLDHWIVHGKIHTWWNLKLQQATLYKNPSDQTVCILINLFY